MSTEDPLTSVLYAYVSLKSRNPWRLGFIPMQRVWHKSAIAPIVFLCGLCALAGNFFVRTLSVAQGWKKSPAKAQRRKGRSAKFREPDSLSVSRPRPSARVAYVCPIGEVKKSSEARFQSDAKSLAQVRDCPESLPFAPLRLGGKLLCPYAECRARMEEVSRKGAKAQRKIGKV
jgi:hypothetical protein